MTFIHQAVNSFAYGTKMRVGLVGVSHEDIRVEGNPHCASSV